MLLQNAPYDEAILFSVCLSHVAECINPLAESRDKIDPIPYKSFNIEKWF